MITVKNLTKIYKTSVKGKGVLGFLKRENKQITALDKINFSVKGGELVGFIGPNGAGKTTTMKILSGILYPTSGEVSVLGFTPFKKEPHFLKQISLIAGQKNQLLWDLPAIDSFRLNKEIYEINDKQFEKTLDNLTTLLKCQHLINQPVKTLSLGERMRMELIVGVLHNPKVLFLDEPTIGLDIFAQKIMRDFIKDYQKLYQATIILTSHNMEDVKELAKRVMIINHGQIIYDGSLEKVIKSYAKEKIITVTLKGSGKKVVYRVRRDQLSRKVQEISKNLDFEDINIEEEKIEDVIRKIFHTYAK